MLYQGSDETQLQTGNRIRREVLGDDHVDKAQSNATEFSEPIQEFVTAYCWGEVWARPGLDKKTRSMLNIAMLTALNRAHEFKVHIRGAIRNGVLKNEIQEILLQTAVYAGVPAALESFRLAQEVFDELESK